jgi:pimeloyl-ACP methyl ester carboxylesterase
MATIVLVPGAMHSAWVWHRVVPLLERSGQRALAPDLPGLGEDRSITPGAATLAGWADFLVAKARETGGSVILVGHSRGGHVIGEAAERAPELVAGLVYVTAILAQPGQNALEAVGADAGAEVLDLSANGVMTMSADVALPIFYNRCTPADAAEAGRRLCPEAYAPTATPSGVSWERWGRVPRAYVECSDDRALPLERQRAMQALAPCDPVFTLDADHSPFLSAAESLADAILGAVRHFGMRRA